MSKISPNRNKKELDADLKALAEYPTMKPKGDSITPVGRFLNMFLEAGSLENLQNRMPQNDISFDYYMKWADGFRAIDHELEKNKTLREKIEQGPRDVSQYLDCVSLTLRLTKKAEELGKYIPNTQKWHKVRVEYKELYTRVRETDPDYALIFVEDIAKPIYKKTRNVKMLAAWGHYQALNYLAQFHYQQSHLSYKDHEVNVMHLKELQHYLEQASGKGSNHATQTIGAICVSNMSKDGIRLDAFQKFRVNYEIAARRGNPTAMIGLGFSLLQREDIFDPLTNATNHTLPKIDFALQILNRAAKDDCTMAHVHLAGFYYTNKMIDKAIDHYKAAIDNEHIPSMLFLARIYMEMSQQGNDKTDLILQYFKMAMDAGNLEARFHLATIYSNTVEWLSKYRNNALAFAHAYSLIHLKFDEVEDKDQRQFITFAKILVADFYRDGTTADGKTNIEKSIEYYEKAIQDFKEHPECFSDHPTEIKLALYQLGLFYLDKSKDESSKGALTKCLGYFKEAANLGHIPSMQIQTQLYEDNITENTPEIVAERIKMHQIVAQQALIEKNLDLAIAEQKSIAIIHGSKHLNPNPDYAAAIRIYEGLLKTHSDVESAFCLGKMHEEGSTPDQKPDFKEAMKYYMLCIKSDTSTEKQYTKLSYLSLGEMAFKGHGFNGKPNYKMALNYYHKISELGDPQAYVLIGFLNLSDTDPSMLPNLTNAMANFRKAKELGYIFTSEDLNEINTELEKFSDSHKDDYKKALHYDLQLLISDQFIDKLLNDITTSVPALLVYPPYLISDQFLPEEKKLAQIDQYLKRLIEIGQAYQGSPISEKNIEIIIGVNTAIASCAKALNLPTIEYAAYKNIAGLHLANPSPDFNEAKRILDLLIYQFDDSESAFIQGQMEERGQNEADKPDYKAAQRAYTLGIRGNTNDLNKANCIVALGHLAFTGNGYPNNKPNLKDALKHYTSVAHLGYNHAYILMGLTHLSQSDTDFSPNIAEAMRAFRIADNKGMDFPADLIKKIQQNLESLKQSDAEAYQKAVHYDLPYLQGYSWIADKFFTAGCKPTDDEKSMIPSLIKWTQEDATLDEKDKENILKGFADFYKAYV